MANSAALKFTCAVFLCMVLAAPHAEAAVTCGMISSKLAPCITYLKGGAGPSGPCCAGVKTLRSMASSPADKKTACGCLKSASSAISGLSYSAAAGLPGKCGVNIPYKISPSTDCSKIN